LGGPSSVDFREADQGGRPALRMSSSVILSGGTEVNNPRQIRANPRYVELSYEQIFDQPEEMPSTFPGTVSPSEGLPFADDPSPDSPQGLD